ncbi:MAG TPA: hypothetical protein VK815_18420 [Candidatus Acidoferrales bacterium]|jgi:hypothetical protein|nr:hypothetical protein [Candidatus Acidoferrales bacterium]
MDENDQTNVPPPIGPSPVIVPPTMLPKPKPLSWWLQKLFVCNPFYLVSAALLLFGCYRVSIDAPLFDVESARLVFNFTSVQFYEILLVLTAIFLARRSIWYDSTLLVGLENLLVFVPFILISQAALIDSGLGLELCLAGAVIAAVRFGGLKKHFTQLNLPGRLLGVGSVFLVLNVTLPLIYRHFGETKVGIHIDSGPAYHMNECTWLLILPAVLALANLLPRARAAGSLLPQHRWLPLGLYTLWIAVTCAHLYGLDFIYQFDLRGELFAPAACVLAWTFFLRVPTRFPWQKYALTLLPLCVPLLSTSPGGRMTFLILAALNLAGYVAVSLFDRSNRLARHFVIAAGLLLIAGLPARWLPAVTPGSVNVSAFGPGLVQMQYVAAGLMAYLVFWTALRRNPMLAVVGAIAFGTAIISVFHLHPGAGYWAFQGGFIFLLLHSLRWIDKENPGANLVRLMAGFFWVLQSFVWMNSDAGRYWMPFIPGAVVLAVCFACRLYQLEWKKSFVPAAAVLVMLSGPGTATVEGLRSAPVGLLAVTASFLLFGFGTLAALTRHHWHKPEPGVAADAARSPGVKS